MSILFFPSSRAYIPCGRCDSDPYGTSRCKAIRGEWRGSDGRSFGSTDSGADAGLGYRLWEGFRNVKRGENVSIWVRYMASNSDQSS